MTDYDSQERALLDRTGGTPFEEAKDGELTVVISRKPIELSETTVPPGSLLIGEKRNREISQVVVQPSLVGIPAEYFGRESGTLAALHIISDSEVGGS